MSDDNKDGELFDKLDLFSKNARFAAKILMLHIAKLNSHIGHELPEINQLCDALKSLSMSRIDKMDEAIVDLQQKIELASVKLRASTHKLTIKENEIQKFIVEYFKLCDSLMAEISTLVEKANSLLEDK